LILDSYLLVLFHSSLHIRHLPYDDDISHEDCTCDFDHMIQIFAGWHDDSSLPKVGILVVATSVVHHGDHLVMF
jgi:hypothetical protein